MIYIVERKSKCYFCTKGKRHNFVITQTIDLLLTNHIQIEVFSNYYNTSYNVSTQQSNRLFTSNKCNSDVK